MEATLNTAKQTVRIEDRKNFYADGVLSILTFDNEYVELSTTYGKMVIEGRDLKIFDLSKETGRVAINGEITTVAYRGAVKKRKGLFG